MALTDISQGVSGGSGIGINDLITAEKVEYATLNLTDVSNKYVTITQAPGAGGKLKVYTMHGVPLQFGVDYSVDAGNNASDLPEFLTQPQFNGTPVVNADLVNKGYVLDVLAGLRDPKDACRVASTANIDLATGGLLSIDGVVTVAGDRVLVKNQTNGEENGIYIAAVGAWSRSTDADSDAEITNGLSVLITEGLMNARKLYVLTTADPIVLNTTVLDFAQAPNPANFLVPENTSVTVDATIDANGYFDLPHQAESKSILIAPLGGPQQKNGSDFTVSVVGGVSRVTFAGDLATRIAIGDELLIKYSYATN